MFKKNVVTFALLLLVGVYSSAISDVFGDQGRVANAVAWAESSMKPNAQNWVYPDASIGLFQINLKAHAGRVPGTTWSEKVQWLENPQNNITMAHELYLESGWSIWGGWSSGAYWKYY